MAGRPDFLYWDSCVFISYFNEHTDRIQTLEAVLAEVRGDDSTFILTSTLTIVEVAAFSHEHSNDALDADTVAALDAMWNDPDVVRLVEFHRIIAREARDLMRWGIPHGYRLKPPDAIHLATAKAHDVYEFHTYDSALEKYETQIGCPIVEPHSTQPKFPNF